MLVILHAGFPQGRFLVWGERSLEEVAASRPRSHNTRKQAIASHPFAADRDQLVQTLGVAGLAHAPSARCTASATAWLPTRAGVPFPSSPVLGDAPRSRARVTLSAWTVPCVEPSPQVMVDLLCACADRTMLDPGVLIGADLAFWARALRFSGAAVAGQRFLPGLRANHGNGPGGARWELAPNADDTSALASLAHEMPAAARALAPDDGHGGDDAASSPAHPPPARLLLGTFVDAVVDYLVRTSASPASGGTRAPRQQRRRQTFDSIHEHWLHALCSEDGALPAPAAQIASLEEQIDAWRAPLAASASAPYRLYLRLEEPADDAPTAEAMEVLSASPGKRPGTKKKRRRETAQDWQVRFLVQAADDPSLMVPAQEVWAARGRRASALARGGADPRTFLLGALGQAASLCPRIERSLATKAPAGYTLDVHGAHAFLTETSLLLEQAGFGVLLPAWWSRKGSKRRLAANAHIESAAKISTKASKLQGQSGIQLDTLVSMRWEVVLGDHAMSLEELEALARLKAPLVRVRGQWVEMSQSEIRAAIDFWKQKSKDRMKLRDAIQMSIGAKEPPGALALAGVSAQGRIAELIGQLDGTRAITEQEPPAGLAGTLRPYQGRGYSWLAFLRELGLGACLADDMGLGKTIQTLALVQRERERGEKRPVLLVCPTSVLANWQREAERFTPGLRVLVHHGIERKKGAAFARSAAKHDLVLSSYALLHRDLDRLQKITWAGVVLDEAQNIKNAETKQASAARALQASYRVALTGTPVENNVGDLWSLMEFLNPGLLGSQARFRKRFFLPIQTQRDPDAADELKRITGPFVLRRLKTDRTIIDDLPEKLEMKVYCNLTKEQASLYMAVLADVEEALESAEEGIQRKGVILAAMSKLKQVCNHPAQLLGDGSAIPGRSGKLARLVDMLDEVVSVGDRALVFTQFSEMGTIIKQHLQEMLGREVLFLHGGVPKQKRDEMVARFQDDAGPPVFLLSLKAGGTGLNLTRASHVFHFDRWWNPAVENQATDRAFRIGQTKNVQVHKMICAGTLEDGIDQMIERKQEIADQVVGTGEGWLTELSNDELRRVFALRAEAIGE